jgi:hypothetical protein
VSFLVLAAALACYTVSARIPADLTPATWSPGVYSRPATVTMGADGTVAVVLAGDGAQRSSVRVVTADGATRDYGLPGPTVLSRRFFAYKTDSYGHKTYPNARIESVALQGRTPIITVSNPFSGGYGGIETGSYRWANGNWVEAVPSRASVHSNYWAVAASPVLSLFGLDDLAQPPPYIAQHSNGYPQAVGALVVSKNNIVALPGIIPTGIQGTGFVGYLSLPNAETDMRSVYAVVGHDRQVSRIDKGIAWAKNSAGYVVGDDRPDLNHPGKPTLFSNGKSVALSDQEGSAFGVNDRGVVAGAISNAGFVYSLHGGKGSVARLDDLLIDRAWHVSAAYFISSSSSIAALASKHGKEPVVVILKADFSHSKGCNG